MNERLEAEKLRILDVVRELAGVRKVEALQVHYEDVGRRFDRVFFGGARFFIAFVAFVCVRAVEHFLAQKMEHTFDEIEKEI